MSDKDKELLKKGGIVIFVGLAVMIYFIIGDLVIKFRNIIAPINRPNMLSSSSTKNIHKRKHCQNICVMWTE